jgi:hypothetical protein
LNGERIRCLFKITHPIVLIIKIFQDLVLVVAVYELPLKNIQSYPTKQIVIGCSIRSKHIGTGGEDTGSPLQAFSDIGCFVKHPMSLSNQSR